MSSPCELSYAVHIFLTAPKVFPGVLCFIFMLLALMRFYAYQFYLAMPTPLLLSFWLGAFAAALDTPVVYQQ